MSWLRVRNARAGRTYHFRMEHRGDGRNGANLADVLGLLLAALRNDVAE